MTQKAKIWSWRHAIQESGLTSTTRHVLLNLGCYMNERGESCFPTIPLQAKDTGLSERAIYRALAIAESAGFLKRSKLTRKGIERNEYTASFPESLDDKHFGVIPVTKPATEKAKQQAVKRVSNLLATTKLQKDLCVACGIDTVEAHHHDYSKAESVFWLCRKHHVLLHTCERQGLIASITPEESIEENNTPDTQSSMSDIQLTPEPKSVAPLTHSQGPITSNNYQFKYPEEEGSERKETYFPPLSSDILKLFNEIHFEVFGYHRSANRSDDKSAAEAIASEGADKIFCGEIFKRKLKEMYESGGKPPAGLSYFKSIIKTEIHHKKLKPGTTDSLTELTEDERKFQRWMKNTPDAISRYFPESKKVGAKKAKELFKKEWEIFQLQ